MDINSEGNYQKLPEFKSAFYIYSLGINLALGGVNFGYNIGVFNAMQDFMQQKFQWSSEEKIFYTSAISSIICIGAIVGVLLTWYLSSLWGRTINVYFIDFFISIGALFTLIESEKAMMFGRFVIGIGVGINTIIIPTFLREISPNEVRGRICGFKEISNGVGTFISYFFEVGLPIPNSAGVYENLSDNWWRVMFAIPIGISLIRSVSMALYFKIESPLYLHLNDQHSEAKDSLRKIFRDDLVKDQLSQLQFEKEKYDNQSSVSAKQLFGIQYRKALFLCLFLVAMQQMSGIDSVQVYADYNFRGNNEMPAMLGRVLSILLALVKFGTAIASALVVDRIGRKPMFLWGTAIITLSLSLLAICNNLGWIYAKAFCFFLYIWAYSISLGPMVWIFVPETLPDKGVTLVLLDHWIFSFLIVQSYPYLVNVALGVSGTFFLYSFCCFICYFVIYFYVPETNKLSREEIFKSFHSEKDIELEKFTNKRNQIGLENEPNIFEMK